MVRVMNSFGVIVRVRVGIRVYVKPLIHDVNPSQLSGASHRSSEAEALLDARRDTVTHRATSKTVLFGCKP